VLAPFWVGRHKTVLFDPLKASVPDRFNLSNILFELGCDVRKYTTQLGADAVNGGNNYNRKSAIDQRIFDGSSRRFVCKEHSELSHHAESIGMAVKDSINGNARIRTLQDLN
jgi:hypothetical protein